MPVYVEGALFACGDCHSAQEDGELCGTGVESPMRVTLRFDVVKNKNLPEIQFQTAGPIGKPAEKGFYATTAHGPDLMDDAKNATRYMINWLVEKHGLTPRQAYILCSTAVDLKISQIVDAPNWIVSAYLPLSIFAS